MNTLIKLNDSKIEIHRQNQRGQLHDSAALARMEVKDEQMAIELRRISALLCVTCDELGRPEKPAVSIDFGPVVDDE